MSWFAPKPPPAPVAKDPVRIPNETDADIVSARKKKMQTDDENKRGRASTQLTPTSDQPYTRTALG